MRIICFSHLRWNFVYQRPQHLLTRITKEFPVFYIEEPQFHPGDNRLDIQVGSSGVQVLTPVLNHSHWGNSHEAVKTLLAEWNKQYHTEFIAWFYTPMALPLLEAFEKPAVVVYDCMDELSAFRFAPPELKENERQLMECADVVFTGGVSLYEAKKELHDNVFPFPSSIDREHFAKALQSGQPEPQDHAGIPHPRIGFFGVIDERFDAELIAGIATLRPDWQIVLIGPVVKIDPVTLPRASNIHYLESKTYDELPTYLGGWDVAMIPFAINESTRFISPTKTPEYLAGGVPVVSTPIRDVVNPYGKNGLVYIADEPVAFTDAIERAMELRKNEQWQIDVDKWLGGISWNRTADDMLVQINSILETKARNPKKRKVSMFDYLIVGAGFAGSVLAERLASENKKILIVDKRNHIGGNAFDHYNKDGLLVHKYGPHIFHTNSKEVFDYLGQFTAWRPYEHRVLASVDGLLVPIPINLNTINALYGLQLCPDDVEKFLEARAEKKTPVRTSEDVVVGKVGRELYEKFFKGYTKKQWDLDPSELDASVAARIPTRSNRDDRYFADTYQGMPLEGYTKMFERMLDNPNISIMLNTDYKEIQDEISFRKMIYTGPVDYYFDYCYGKLPYRSLEFRFETKDLEVAQQTGTINYPNEHPFTRITEFKYLTGQRHHKTTVVYEYPQAEGDPYYPVPRPENAELYRRYQLLADGTPNVYFTGRLATYKYYNMDQVVAQSLSLFKKIKSAPGEIPSVNGHRLPAVLKTANG